MGYVAGNGGVVFLVWDPLGRRDRAWAFVVVVVAIGVGGIGGCASIDQVEGTRAGKVDVIVTAAVPPPPAPASLSLLSPPPSCP